MSNLGDPPPVAGTLGAARAAIADTAYPLALPGAPAARAARDALLGQFDDYLIPRLTRLDAPLLVVVGGSTGAGKSTLVNSLVQAPVTTAGVLRPTTRAPVLVSHPTDAPWFRRPHVLPGLPRNTAAQSTPDSLHLVSAHALIPGLALLDTPDIDSVLDRNRALAGQLLAAADLWLFVTTAARYADAVPWRLLDTARDRGAAVALVLDRVPSEAADEVTAHFTELLAAHGWDSAPLFVVPETVIDGQGLLPDRTVAPLRTWLAELARDAAARDRVVRGTAAGALRAAAHVARGLATAAEDQAAATTDLTDRVRLAYHAGSAAVADGIAEHVPLRGPVLTAWQEFVDTGQLVAAARARLNGLGIRVVTTVTGRRAPGGKLKRAIRYSLADLVSLAGTTAAERAAADWRAHPAGTELLTAASRGQPPAPPEPIDLAAPSADLPSQAELLVREWQRDLPRLVRAGLAGARKGPRMTTYSVNCTALLVMIAALAGGAVPAELATAMSGAPDPTARRHLRVVLRDRVVNELAVRAHEDLLTRVGQLFDQEAGRYLAVLAAARVLTDPVERLRQAAEALAQLARSVEPPAGSAEPAAGSVEPAAGSVEPVASPVEPAGPEVRREAAPEPGPEAGETTDAGQQTEVEAGEPTEARPQAQVAPAQAVAAVQSGPEPMSVSVPAQRSRRRKARRRES